MICSILESNAARKKAGMTCLWALQADAAVDAADLQRHLARSERGCPLSLRYR